MAIILELPPPDHREDEGDDDSQKLPQVGEDLADVVAAAAGDGEGALQKAAREPSVGLPVTRAQCCCVGAAPVAGRGGCR